MPLMIDSRAALTSSSNSVSYITFLFSEWRIVVQVPFHNRTLGICVVTNIDLFTAVDEFHRSRISQNVQVKWRILEL